MVSWVKLLECLQKYSRNLNLMSKSSKLIIHFKNNTQEITKLMKGMQFTTINLRNKLTEGCTNDNYPITTQVLAVNNTTQQVKVNIYLLLNNAGQKPGGVSTRIYTYTSRSCPMRSPRRITPFHCQTVALPHPTDTTTQALRAFRL